MSVIQSTAPPAFEPTTIRSNKTTQLANYQLHQSVYREIQSLQVRLRGGQLVLEGIVSSYYLKQVAQTLVKKTVGATRLVNNVEVVYPLNSRRRVQ